jgi:serine/threonine protein kinase
VDYFGHARITDFGLAVVIQNSDSTGSSSNCGGHSPRWTAPEVLEGGVYSKKSDIFSFAMVMIEVRHEWLPVSVLSLLWLHIGPGIHRCDPFQWNTGCDGYVRDIEWRAPGTATPSNLHESIVGIGTKLLE